MPEPPCGTWKLKYRIAYAVIFKKLQDKLGGRVTWMTASGAPTAPEIIRFFNAAGITVIQGYGMTETTALFLFVMTESSKVESQRYCFHFVRRADAVNPGEFFFLCFADGDYPGADPGKEPLGTNEKTCGGCIEIAVEDMAVKSVQYHRHTFLPGGDPAQRTGLCSMGVHDVGLEFTDYLSDV